VERNSGTVCLKKRRGLKRGGKKRTSFASQIATKHVPSRLRGEVGKKGSVTTFLELRTRVSGWELTWRLKKRSSTTETIHGHNSEDEKT